LSLTIVTQNTNICILTNVRAEIYEIIFAYTDNASRESPGI
jgi:hypothetical protein